MGTKTCYKCKISMNDDMIYCPYCGTANGKPLVMTKLDYDSGVENFTVSGKARYVLKWNIDNEIEKITKKLEYAGKIVEKVHLDDPEKIWMPLVGSQWYASGKVYWKSRKK